MTRISKTKQNKNSNQGKKTLQQKNGKRLQQTLHIKGSPNLPKHVQRCSTSLSVKCKRNPQCNPLHAYRMVIMKKIGNIKC